MNKPINPQIIALADAIGGGFKQKPANAESIIFANTPDINCPSKKSNPVLWEELKLALRVRHNLEIYAQPKGNQFLVCPVGYLEDAPVINDAAAADAIRVYEATEAEAAALTASLMQRLASKT